MLRRSVVSTISSPGGAGGEEPDGAELGAAREDEHRERLRLDEREPGAAGRDGVGERERDDAEPERRQGQEAAPERAVVAAAPSIRSILRALGAVAIGDGDRKRETPPAAASGGVSEWGSSRE